jgi:carboxyl-terminal processing protease
VVLLPEEAEQWTEDRVRMVLIHELAHVQRSDCLVQVLWHLVRGLYWWQPLAWLAAQQLRLEQEQACDDMVLKEGVNAPDYAEHVLAVTTGLSTSFWASPVALGVSRTEKLRRRLVRLLDDRSTHLPLDRRALIKAAALVLVFAVVLGLVGFTSTPAAGQTDQGKAQQPAPAKDNETLKRLTEVQQKLAKHYVAPVDEKVLFNGALQGMLKGLKDPYTTYLPADALAELEKSNKGVITGIGLQLTKVDDRLAVVTPVEGSPALKAGLVPGDEIAAIDGQSTQGLPLTQVVQRILGPAGSVVKLKVVNPDGVVREVAVTRAEIRLNTVNGFQRGGDGKWQFVLDDVHKIGYLQVTQFGSHTATEVREIVQGLHKAGLKGLILDLRFCPGGLLDQAVEVSKLFLAKGVVVTIRGPGKEEKVWEADGKSTLGDFPLLVLLNDHTASAAEIVAGALRDNNRAVLLGTRSFGKGSVQTLIQLDQGGALKMTTANYYLPGGRNIQKRPGEKSWGVDPNDGFNIPLTGSQTDALLNNQHQRALLYVNKEDRSPNNARLSPKLLQEVHADPQLAAALRTMVARLTGGEFIKVGKDNAAVADQVQRLEELTRRREQLQQSMSELEREIADLQKGPSKVIDPDR